MGTNSKKLIEQLRDRIKTLREITDIKDPEQHFEQIMEACKAKSQQIEQLQAEITRKNKALEKISRCNYYKPAVWIAEQALKGKSDE